MSYQELSDKKGVI